MQLPVLRRYRRLAAVAALTAAAVLGTLGPAAPAQADPDSEELCPPIYPKWTLQAKGPQYLITTDSPFQVDTSFGLHWSAVAVVGRMYNADLLLNPRPANLCNTLGSSADPNPLTVDWVAVDDVRDSKNSYVVRPTAIVSEPWWGGFGAQLVTGSQSVSTSNPNTPQAVGRPDGWIVDVKSVDLYKENTYAISGDAYISRIYLLGSDDGDPATWTRTPDSATLIASREKSDQPLSGLVRVDRDGPYGLLFTYGYGDPAATDRRGHVTIETIPDCGPSGCNFPKPKP